MEKGCFVEAGEIFSALINGGAKIGGLRCSYALTLVRLGRIAEARDALIDELKLFPLNHFARQLLVHRLSALSGVDGQSGIGPADFPDSADLTFPSVTMIVACGDDLTD